ncbi:valyl-tRNA synthetase [Oceanobacillus picturae]|uniref:Valyl-tRNA synthetase n=1 Tax=Oceanobacillus picturae TaxID=171693 RepID=A0A0U9H9T7_9BACI|nr:hypothetical protein [Oceanobacillus picturae]GAQ18049.1 valyl-tRNA synthetase [Oceanobacillus picturae]
MTKMYIYHCNAPGCGADYGVIEEPLSCPYCDSVALYDEPVALIENYESGRELINENTNK